VTRQRILIVGGGFLGRAAALALNGAGHVVTVLSPHTEPEHWPTGIGAICGRQEDAGVVAGLLRDCEMVVHAAWGTTPGSSAGRPTGELQEGLFPFLAFMQTLQEFPHVRLLFLSSGGTVYGDSGPLPADEQCARRPRSCHGAGKAAAELFLGTLRPASHAGTVIVRPANVYGPGQPQKQGFGVVPQLVGCALEGRSFQLWGDGSQVRDYVYVEDFAEATVRLVERPGLHGVFNVGSGVGTSLGELIALVEKVTGRPVRLERRAARASDVARIVLDVGRIREATGWVPRVYLEKGLAQTWRWLRGRA
jgi:UDP-glucose 4-epimerase